MDRLIRVQGPRMVYSIDLAEKLTFKLCSAISSSRPTAAGEMASGERRVCNEANV